MALTTRCPQCGTTFKVVADQLRIRSGLVRCGVCASVFDGREYLDEAPLPAVSRAPASYAPAAPDTRTAPHAPTAPHVPAAPYSPTAPHAHAAPYAPTAPHAPPVPHVPPAPYAPAASYTAPAPDVLRTRSTTSLREEREEPGWRVDTDTSGGSDYAYSRGEDYSAREATRRHDAQDVAPAYLAASNVPVGRGSSTVYRPQEAASYTARHEDLSPEQTGETFTNNRFYGERKEQDGAREPALREPLESDDAIRGEPRTRYVDDYHSGRTPPSFMDDGAQAHQAHRSRLWGVGCLVLFLVLLGMLVHTYRNQVAASFPALRPALEAACRPLACTIGYERKIERISIISSSLQAAPGGGIASADAQELVLTVVMRNRYNAPQVWPALTLELKDLADRVVVRKVLYAKDYLPKEVAAQPFGANAERRLIVPISVRDVQINGYQIDKFFP